MTGTLVRAGGPGAPEAPISPWWIAAFGTAPVLLGLVVGELVTAGKGVAVVGLVVVVLPPLLWKRPYLTPAVLLFGALTIEQFPDPLSPSYARATSGIPLFHGLGSLHLAPADLLLLLGGVLALVKHLERPAAARRPIPWPILGIAGAVLVGLASGMLHHGDLRVMFMETRPYVYLIATYFLACAFLTSRRSLQAVLWTIVMAAAFKATQALLIFVAVRHEVPRPEAVLGHEDALFFGIFIFLTGALWLFDIRTRMRTMATWVLPLVIAADLANSRRAAWLVLGGGCVVLAIIAAKAMPWRRLLVLRIGAVVGVLLAVYMPAYWNKSGGLAQPARAIRSIVAPNTRDASSDLYRVQENLNLKVNIRRGGILGRGFGVPIDYPIEIADISDIDPLIAYVPHNGVLYVLMRMGVAGGIALWALIGVALIGACRLARSRDRELAVVGAFVASALIGYAMEGGIDQGFFFYRVGFVMGTLLALAEAARRLERRAPGVAA
jgi:hypothetical protein